jgi:hypothetical protein
VTIVPGVLTLSAALAIALTGNSLPFLQQGGATVPSQSGPIQSGPSQSGPGPARPSCDPPWTIAMVTDGSWECAGGPGPVVLP